MPQRQHLPRAAVDGVKQAYAVHGPQNQRNAKGTTTKDKQRYASQVKEKTYAGSDGNLNDKLQSLNRKKPKIAEIESRYGFEKSRAHVNKSELLPSGSQQEDHQTPFGVRGVPKTRPNNEVVN